MQMKLWRRLALLVTLLTPCLGRGVEINPDDFSATKPEDPYEVVAPRTTQAPAIAGDLGDAAWGKAAVLKGFWKAGASELAGDQTLAWLCFDAENLYIACACQDRKLVADPVARDDKTVWRQDSVELFLSPERDGGAERQLILSAAESIFDRRPGQEYGEGGRGWNPTWDGKVKRQPWGYTCEMRVPLAELTDLKKFPVVRGTVWTMKLTREDAGGATGLRTSSWTPIGPATGDRRAVGKLIFEDRNVLANGGAEIVNAEGALSDWSVEASKVTVTVASTTDEKTDGARGAAVAVKGRKLEGAQARVRFGAANIPPAPAETTYLFTADVKAVCPDNTLIAYVVAFQGGKVEQLNFPHNAGWQKVRTMITAEAGAPVDLPLLQTGPVSEASRKEEGGGMVYIDNVRVEAMDMVDTGLDPDSVCLTGNAVDAYRTRNARADGAYTYTEAMTLDTCFPHYFAPGSEAGSPQDFGLYRGEIPFDKGRLTDGHASTSVNWPTFWTGHQGRDFTFDLKKEYEITRVVVKVTWTGLAWKGQTLSGMEAKLYMTEWVNPKPGLKIVKIILRTTYDPTPMNPMLLAVTAIDARLAGKPSEQKLPSASLLQPPTPEGVPVDLSGGKDESELRYVAPDGTTIEAAMLHNGLSDNAANAFLINDWRSYVGHVTVGGYQAARTDKLVFTFPKPARPTTMASAA